MVFCLKSNQMTLEQIKQAVNNGQAVYWMTTRYKVIKDGDNYLIMCDNGYCIGLTWVDGVTLNGKENEFFTF